MSINTTPKEKPTGDSNPTTGAINMMDFPIERPIGKVFVNSSFPSTRSEILLPQFDQIPHDLIERPFWCCWKEIKRPRAAKQMLPPISIREPGEWSSFALARAAFDKFEAWGIGTLLDGDGLTVVDIDHCVHEGTPHPDAIEAMRLLGIGYVEISPSGHGLHGFGYLEGGYRAHIRIGGVDAELYSQRRFITVTGVTVWNHGVKNIDASQLLEHAKIGATEENEDTEDFDESDDKDDIECNASLSYPSSVASVRVRDHEHRLPSSCTPISEGQRNRKLFELARFLRGICPDLTESEQKTCVRQWHDLYKTVIATKDFGDSWLDFKHGWTRVTTPYGQRLEAALGRMDDFTVPESVAEYGKGLCRLYQLCRALANQDEGTFFLSMPTVAEALGCDVSTISRQIARLREDGVLEVVEAHIVNKRARRFRFKNDALQANTFAPVEAINPNDLEAP